MNVNVPGKTLIAFCFATLTVFTLQAEETVSELEPKKPCVAIAPPKAQLGQGASGQDVALPVQNLLVSYLSGPMLDVVALQSRLPAQLKAEAEQAGCETMLTAEVTYKKKKSFGKAFAIGAGVLSSALPFAGVGGGVGGYVAANAAANAANSAANAQMQEESINALSAAQGSVRSGDAVSITYALKQAGAKKPIASNQFEAKASADGEDLLVPLVEQTATEVFGKLVE